MSAADDAYAAAEKLISDAKAEKATRLSFDRLATRALTRLPPEIGTLDALMSLWLNNTQVTDLAPLQTLTGLQVLSLTSTPVTDLAALQALTGLQQLYLARTQVTDLAPLQALTGLQELVLTSTPVTDLAPLQALTGLQTLRLDNTQVTDLAPLQALAGLQSLWLNNTQVTDLRPIRDLASLIEGAKIPRLYKPGLHFQNTPATRAYPELKRLSEIEDDADRTEATLAYLRTLPPLDQPLPSGTEDDDKHKDSDLPDLPERKPAPLETEISEGQLRRAAPARPFKDDDPGAARAQTAWEELTAFSQGFQRSFNISNYPPLPDILGAFDRSLAESFTSMRQIGVGIHGMRLSALSRDTEFCARLPDGCATELGSFALAIETLVNRFPDWVAYKEEAEQAPDTARDVAETRDAFESLHAALADTAAVSDEVTEEFGAEVKGVTGNPNSEELAKGIVDSTRDVVLTVSEAVVAEARSGEKFRQFVARQRATGTTEWPKAEYWAAGVWLDLLGRGNPHLRKLTKRFPAQLGWLDRVLDYCGFDPG